MNRFYLSSSKGGQFVRIRSKGFNDTIRNVQIGTLNPCRVHERVGYAHTVQMARAR